MSSATEGVTKGMVVSDSAGLVFSKDGARLFLGLAHGPKPKPKDAPEPVAPSSEAATAPDEG